MTNIFSPATVLEILKASFQKVAHFDYAKKFTENEEDIRASIYRYVRNVLDVDLNWRVFLSYSTKEDASSTNLHKPDMVFVRSENDYQIVKVEIFVEMKNWPSLEEIENDVRRLIELRKGFENDNPILVFLGILGTSFKSENVQDVERKIKTKFKNPEYLHVWLKKHNDIYEDPWYENEHTDPWRKKLRRR